MTNKFKEISGYFVEKPVVAIVLISVLLLLPTLFFPISPDLTVFYFGGKTIAEGGRMYADYIDLKPPSIFLIMAPVYKFFGNGEITIRLSDMLYQLATVLSIFYIVRKRVNGNSLAAYSALIYALIYGSLRFEIAFQCETAIALPTVWAIYFLSGRESVRYSAFAGLLLGAACSFKYSLVFLAPAGLIIEFLKGKRSLLYRAVALTFSFGIGFGLPHLVLLAGASLDGYIEAMKFLNIYVNNDASRRPFDAVFIIRVARYFLGVVFSYPVLFLAIIGLYFGAKGKLNYIRGVYSTSVILSIALLASIIFEGKYLNYHWIRLLVPMAFLAAMGVASLQKYSTGFKNLSIMRKSAIIAVIVVAAYFSPLHGYAGNIYNAYQFFSSQTKYEEAYEDSTSFVKRSLQEWRYIANRVRHDGSNNGLAIVVSHGDQPLYYYLKAKEISKFAHSGFFFLPASAEKYKEGFVEELTRAKTVIIRTDAGDINNLGSYDSDWGVLNRNPGLSRILQDKYNENFHTRHFRIFYRK